MPHALQELSWSALFLELPCTNIRIARCNREDVAHVVPQIPQFVRQGLSAPDAIHAVACVE
eukprot:4517397-Amphidinium_carterae.1